MWPDLDNLLAPQLFEISKKEQTQRNKQAKDLQDRIAKIQAEVDEIRDNKIFLGAFEWRIEFPEVLDEDGRFVGFDCVIGNPPYIQLQKMGADADALQKMSYETYERTGDIYCLFYEMGMKLLKPGALLSFITSNKWMRAGYGKSLREHLSSRYNPTLLIDFANNKIFDSATVLVNILSLEKSNNQGHTLSCSVEDGFDVSKLSDYVQTHTQVSSFRTDDTWSILSEIELSIKRKVEEAGVPLKDWDVELYRGVLTGYNDAFIITSEKREEILSHCTDDAERERTAEIIRPILRGRDIRRYGYEWADLWLINTHNGVKDSLERIHIEDYPAIKQHLDYYWDKIESRADKGDTPYNLRNCAYVDEFSKPKIVWGNLNTRGSYAMTPENMFINAPACMIVPGSHYLLAMLNSKVADYYIRNLGVVRNGGFFEYKPMFVEQIPVPSPREEVVTSIEEVFNSDASDEQKEKRLEEIIESLFDFTEPEIAYLRNQ